MARHSLSKTKGEVKPRLAELCGGRLRLPLHSGAGTHTTNPFQPDCQPDPHHLVGKLPAKATSFLFERRVHLSFHLFNQSYQTVSPITMNEYLAETDAVSARTT